MLKYGPDLLDHETHDSNETHETNDSMNPAD